MSTCEDARAFLSAALDGETDLDAAPAPVRAHLASCDACARWVDRAAQVNRLLWISRVREDDPGLAESVLAQVQLPRGRQWPMLRWPMLRWLTSRWPTLLRVALALVALAQLTIGLASLLGPIAMSPAMPDSAHMNHEEAAFNIAFGISLITVAWNGRRAGSHVPVLATFVVILAISSVFDLLDGSVNWQRLATHLPILLGLVLSAAIGRHTSTEPGPDTCAARPGRMWPHRPASALRGKVPSRDRHDRPAPPPAARRDVA